MPRLSDFVASSAAATATAAGTRRATDGSSGAAAAPAASGSLQRGGVPAVAAAGARGEALPPCMPVAATPAAPLAAPKQRAPPTPEQVRVGIQRLEALTAWRTAAHGPRQFRHPDGTLQPAPPPARTPYTVVSPAAGGSGEGGGKGLCLSAVLLHIRG